MTEAAPIGELPEDARTLPGDLYWSRETFADDMERIYSRLWVCVGREDDLAEPGDFFTKNVGRESILVLRGNDGQARAFYNVCRHRGSRLVLEESGHVGRILCPYHAWAYGLDGRLVSSPLFPPQGTAAAPLVERRAGFAREEHGLVGVRLKTWMGFLFVNLDDGAPDLSEQLAGVPDLSRFGLAALRRVERIVYEVEANWKVLCENYGECYHCPLAHPQLNRVSDFRNVGWSVKGSFFNGGPMRLNEGSATLSMSGKTDRLLLSEDPEDSTFVNYFHLYPGFLLSIAPDYAMTHTLWPLAPDRTRVICEWLFAEETAAADVVEFWDLTNRQDWELCARVQQGTGSRGYRRGPYHDMELCVYTFDSWYLGYRNGAASGEA